VPNEQQLTAEAGERAALTRNPEIRRRQPFHTTSHGTSQGLTVPIAGIGGDWIVKLPSPRFDAVPENEYAMMTLAQAVGLDVPEVRLVPTKDIAGLPPDLPDAFGQSLAVRRFDRPHPGERVHIEDFAQVFGRLTSEQAQESELRQHRAFYGWKRAKKQSRTTLVLPKSTWMASVALPKRRVCLCASFGGQRVKQPKDCADSGRPTNRCGRYPNAFARRLRNIWRRSLSNSVAPLPEPWPMRTV
jgi:HipA-like protein